MQFIPVIDILKGQVVHAYCGRRESYQPITSRLCPGTRPEDIAAAFLELYPFGIIYLADLDAIAGRGDNSRLVQELSRRFPEVEFWIDRGDNGACDDNGSVPVLGAETGLMPERLRQARDRRPDSVLSLDFNGGGFMGETELLENSDSWPQRCIVMSLQRVGSGSGPDLALLRSLRQRAPGRDFYLAGGIRNQDDLMQTRQAGAAGALLASALHNGSITAKTLQTFSDN